MSKMIPSSPLGNNKGEIEVFNVLQKGGDDVVVWQSAQLSHKHLRTKITVKYEADFLVYAPKTGIIVLEVKNISLDRLISGNYYETKSRDNYDSADMQKSMSFTEKKAKEDNAQRQAELYLGVLKDLLEDWFPNGVTPPYSGVILPNITRKDY